MNPETGELTESQVEDIYSRTVPEYYEVTVKMPDGTKEIIKVTGEHPLYVKKGNEETTRTTRFEKIQTSLLSLFSHIKERVSDLF